MKSLPSRLFCSAGWPVCLPSSANCILQWASYKSYPWCPQCRLPFSSLYLYKTLDGRSDSLLLMRRSFVPDVSPHWCFARTAASVDVIHLHTTMFSLLADSLTTCRRRASAFYCVRRGTSHASSWKNMRWKLSTKRKKRRMAMTRSIIPGKD